MQEKILPEELDGIERSVSKSGNGAHVYVPKEWKGEIVRVIRVCDYWPDLVKPIVDNLSEDILDVIVEFENDKFDETLEISGKVFDVFMNENNDYMESVVKISTEDSPKNQSLEYEIRIKREVGSDGWSESDYIIQRKIEDLEKTNNIVKLTKNYMWEDIGTVKSIYVKNTV